MSIAKAGLVVGIIGLIIAAAAFVQDVVANREPDERIFKAEDRFTCQSRPYPNEGEIWTVMYHNDKGTRPWLRMVNTFGPDWNTPKRCDTIAERLETYRKDGLLEFSYRYDPNTPKQAVICAKTKLSGNNCPLLVTLMQDADAYESLSKMIEALKTGNTVDQSGKSLPSEPILSPSLPSVNLENFLSAEDLKVGSTDAK